MIVIHTGLDFCGTPPNEEGSDTEIAELFTNYWYGSYEGGGEAVVHYKNGLWGVHGMGHCSCYGPFDRWAPATYPSWEECKKRVEKDLVDRIELYFKNIGESVSGTSLWTSFTKEQ